MKKLWMAFFAGLFIMALGTAARAAAPLKLIAKYQMPADVKGRFDHLGVDVRANRLFLAAESAHEVLVFNLGTGKFIRAITGIGIPHAIFVREDLNRIFITDGGAGEVKMYDGKTYRLLGAAKLKVDTDSIGYDPATHYLYVDNGGGDAHETFSMLSVIDTNSGSKVADIKIDGDTLEAMALESGSAKLYVNNPAKSEVDVVDRKTRQLLASWPVTMGKRNVAMALDEPSHRLFVACRSGVIVVFDTETGKELQALPISTGVDDLIFNSQTKRIYASCGSGAGALYVYHENDPDHYNLLGQVVSAPGGKNEVLAASLGRLFITVPPQGTAPGAAYEYKVQ
ncbi:MAG: YncE family protein [Candidatus Acidiferrales bacterium]